MRFLNVDNKPIIIYTLEAFQQHPNIDEISGEMYLTTQMLMNFMLHLTYWFLIIPVLFDFELLKKPMVCYAYDYDEFYKNYGLYFTLIFDKNFPMA